MHQLVQVENAPIGEKVSARRLTSGGVSHSKAEASMSYTIVVDEQERARRYENSLNILVRRCKIGKVTRKPLSTDGLRPWATDPNVSNWWSRNTQPRKCLCLPGQACGNAACPHALFATSTSAAERLIPAHGISI